MSKFFSDKIEEGIRLVWMQYDPEKIKEGRVLLEQVAQDGDADGYCFLALADIGISCLPQYNNEVFTLLRESVARGSLYGMLVMYWYDILAEELENTVSLSHLKEATDMVMKKAEDGHALCQMIVGMFYYCGGYRHVICTEKQECKTEKEQFNAAMTEAVPWFEKALYGGITTSLDYLYNIYIKSNKTLIDRNTMENLLGFGARKGDMVWLGKYIDIMCDNGNYEDAFQWIEVMAQEGFIKVWYNMGCQYEKGMGVESNKKKAIDMLEKGAKAGSPECQTRLGKHLLWGKITQKNEAQAYYWFAKAGEQGDETAKMYQGHCLLYGLGVKEDKYKGTNMLIDALNYNYPMRGESYLIGAKSKFNWKEDMLQLIWDLGDANENGLGCIQKNIHYAGYYFSLVAAGGWSEGIEKMTHYKMGLFRKWKKIK